MVSTFFTAVSGPVSGRSVDGQWGKASLSVCLVGMRTDVLRGLDAASTRPRCAHRRAYAASMRPRCGLDVASTRPSAPPPPVGLFNRASDVCFFGALFSFPNNPAPCKRRKPSECLDHVAVRKAETQTGFLTSIHPPKMR